MWVYKVSLYDEVTLLDEAIVREGSCPIGLHINLRDVFSVTKIDGDDVTIRKGAFIGVTKKCWVIPSRPHTAVTTPANVAFRERAAEKMRAQGEGSVFKVGDVVYMKPLTVIGIDYFEPGLPRRINLTDGWEVLSVDADRKRYYVGNLGARTWVDESSLIPRPASQPKVANEVKFEVGDVVDLLVGTTFLSNGSWYTKNEGSPSDWTILEVCDVNNYRVKRGTVSGWVHRDAIIPRLKPAPLAQTVRVIDMSESVGLHGTHLRVRLTDEDSGVDVLFRADLTDKTIHVGDEYTVTIAKKGH